VARGSGNRRQLGGQRTSKAVAGPWKDLTDFRNRWPSNLTVQLRSTCPRWLTAIATGDLTQKITLTCAARSSIKA